MKLVLAGLVLVIGLAVGGCSSIKRLWGTDGKKVYKVRTARFEDALVEAAAGDAEAQFSLGEMYREGNGVGRNFAQAYAWYKIAAMNGHLGAVAKTRAGWIAENKKLGEEQVEVLKKLYPNAVIP